MDNRPRVLVVDDEPQIHRFLGPALSAAGYNPIRAETGRIGLQLLTEKSPDILVLDLGLPDMDGKSLLKQARAFYTRPVVVLSSREHCEEKIAALDLGADDYVQKPFDIAEFLARLRSALRRETTQAGHQQVVKSGNLEIDIVNHIVINDGVRMHLTNREYKLLSMLVRTPGRILSHHQLAEGVWGPHRSDNIQYVRVLVQHLRQKLEPYPSRPCHIINEAGIGYRFV